MQPIHFKHRLYQLLSILSLYALVLNLCIPTAMAVGQIQSGFYHYKAESRDTVSVPVVYNIPRETAPVVEESVIQAADHVVGTAVASSSGGPGQTDHSGMSLNNNDNILNKFTGDMSYSIPLADVEGFPISISYNPNIGMDQEASWVGLGWDLSLGSINREMRGVPDDFSGDVVERVFKNKDEEIDGKKSGAAVTVGFGIPLGQSPYGPTLAVSVNAQLLTGKYDNNYLGIGHTKDIGVGLGLSAFGLGAGGSLGFSADDQNGIGRSLSFDVGVSPQNIGPLGGSYSYGKTWGLGSRNGMKTVNTTSGFSVSASSKALGVSVKSSSSKGSLQTFGVQTYIPRYQINRNSSGSSTTRAFGATGVFTSLFVSDKHIFMNYDQESRVSSNSNNLRAFGYYNLSKSGNDTEAMLDFNRDGNNQVSSTSKHMGFAAATQDMYYCNAPGLGSNYRAHRYEAFRLDDPEVSSNGNSENKGTTVMGTIGIVAPPVTYIVGLDVGANSGSTLSESSTGEGNHLSHFAYTDPASTFDGREYYIKSIGEMTPVDASMLQSYQGETAVSLELQESSGVIQPTGNIKGKGIFSALPGTNKNLNRPDNVIHYREYTGAEAAAYDKSVYSYELYNCESPRMSKDPQPIYSTSASKPGHLISAVDVTNENGMRYVFGIPSFNYMQKEVAFSASGLKSDADFKRTGLVAYNGGTDNSLSNNRGRQGMFDATTVPGYASSFLLSEMFSSDYIDRTQNGPTPDDQGNYYKLNYTNVYGETNANKFKWRMPMTAGDGSTFDKTSNLAILSENLTSDPWDDVASYVYGEKDLWYARSVESKNFIAYFCLEDRIDQFSAAGENGGLDPAKPGKLLKRIKIFSRLDIERGNTNNPIQVIEFEYDYSLCQDYVGNRNTHGTFYGANTGEGTGKLTLKRIYSYTGRSGEMKRAPIVLEYASGAGNPIYAFNSADRWGNYKPNDIDFPNHILPYSEQRENEANVNIQAWKLKKVIQPSGMEVEFFYEADRYSYVQDERAMRMFHIQGMSNPNTLAALESTSEPTSSDLLAMGVQNNFRNPSNEEDHYSVVYFKLEEPIVINPAGDIPDINAAHAAVKKRYFTNSKGQVNSEFLFNMFVDLGNEGTDVSNYETVQSMASIATNMEFQAGRPFAGVVGNGTTLQYGYVVLLSQKVEDFYVNPLILANWQFARLNAPYTIYGSPDYAASSSTDFCDYSNSLDWTVVFGGEINKRINKKGYGNVFSTDRSFIRLFEPDGIKFGGNARISSIQYKDGWEASGEAGASYKWNYGYAEKEGKACPTTGVAAYEPKVGGDENPLYRMDAYSKKRYVLPDEKSYQFLPLAEILFPAPVVGYEEVTTQFGNTAISVAKSVGKTVEAFHTAKDLPTIVRPTTDAILKVNLTEETAIKEKGYVKEVQGYSEGFVVITNDFHGKPKSSTIYDASGAKISSSRYKYVDPNSGRIKYLKRDGTIIESLTPREIDIYTDSWKNKSSVIVADQSKVLSTALVYTLPFVFIPYLGFSKDTYSSRIESEIQGFTFEKVINHSAVVESVETFTLGSYNTARNILYDARTGSVLLSSLMDEFEDALYNFSYPAHWKYSAFENMNQTDNAVFKQNSGSGGIITASSPLGLRLHAGDQLKIYNTGVFLQDAWVLQANGINATLIDENGTPISGIPWLTAEIRVVKTGKKNILGLDMMGITTKTNPVSAVTHTFSFPQTNIINSSASRFAENKNVPCPGGSTNTIAAYHYDGEENTSEYAINSSINPFLKGVMGNYRFYSAFSFQDGRTNFEESHGIRQDGTLKNYVPFYTQVSGTWYAIDESGHPSYASGSLGSWRQTGKMDEFSEWGSAVQSSDQLTIASASIEASDRSLTPLQAASAVNAELREIGFDGFEIYNTAPQSLQTPQFSLSSAFASGASINPSAKHSGNHSMQVSTTASTDKFHTFFMAVGAQDNIQGGEYLVRACNCMQSFSPSVSKSYLVSAWVKEELGGVPYTSSSIVVEYLDVAGTTVIASETFTPQGDIIEGWQKIEGKYTVHPLSSWIRFKFVNSNAGSSYFDDFRTHPFLAGMTSVVYDPQTLQPMAEHDGYNFTTFYNYDENHQLVRVRVETTEGIITVSESESGIRKQH